MACDPPCDLLTMVTTFRASWQRRAFMVCILTWLVHSANGLEVPEKRMMENPPNSSDEDIYHAQESIRSTQVLPETNSENSFLQRTSPDQAISTQRHFQYPKRTSHPVVARDFPRGTGVGTWEEIELFQKKDPRKARQYQSRSELNSSSLVDAKISALLMLPTIALTWCWHTVYVSL